MYLSLNSKNIFKNNEYSLSQQQIRPLPVARTDLKTVSWLIVRNCESCLDKHDRTSVISVLLHRNADTSDIPSICLPLSSHTCEKLQKARYLCDLIPKVLKTKKFEIWPDRVKILRRQQNVETSECFSSASWTIHLRIWILGNGDLFFFYFCVNSLTSDIFIYIYIYIWILTDVC